MALKEILVEWDTFNFQIWVVIGPNRCLPSYVKKRHRRVYRSNVRHATEVGGLYFPYLGPKRWGILWLPKRPTTPSELGYLAHEMGHAVMDMHSQCGLNLDNLNDETFCYALARGVTTVLQELRKR